MSDLIDREKLRSELLDIMDRVDYANADLLIKNQPAIQQERTAELVQGVNYPECSECKEMTIEDSPKFCPNCGAKFKEDQDGR